MSSDETVGVRTVTAGHAVCVVIVTNAGHGLMPVNNEIIIIACLIDDS